MRATASLTRRAIAAATATACVAAQLTLPLQAAAAASGSSTVSAGSAAPPAAQAIQSFQPDLFTGRATTSVPIAVPPGRKGMQPALALAYSSSARNGWLGVGWSLDAGYIERSTKNGVPKYDSTDTFTFMFQGVASDLVDAGGGEYRSEDEGLFLRIRNNGASGWEITDKSGTRYRFGQTAASQIESLGKTFRWCLDKVIDTNGNSMSFAYEKDQNQIYLKQITYTGHETEAVAAANRVDLITETRPDVETSLRSGFAVTTARRLKSIETRATVDGAPSLARRYELAYAASARTNRSLLAGVTQVGADGTTALPATTFTYTQDALDYLHCHNCVPGLTTGNNGWQLQIASGHRFPHDGGGNDQRLWPSGSWEPGVKNWGEEICQRRLFRKQCQTVPRSAAIPPIFWSAPHLEKNGSSDGANWSTDSDGNLSVSGPQDTHVLALTWLYRASSATASISTGGSSRADIFYVQPGGNTWVAASGGQVPLAAGWTVVAVAAYNEMDGLSLSIGGSLASQADAMNHGQFSPMGVAADFNGDGMPDIGHFDPPNNHWHVSLNSPSGFGQERTWLSATRPASTATLVGDVDADGKADLILWDSNSGLWEVAQSDGASFESPVAWRSGMGAGETPFMGDFNGDGLLDVGTVSAGGRWQVALSTGADLGPPAAWLSSFGPGVSPLTGDFNGDGLTDIAETDGQNVRVALSTGSGFAPQAGVWTSSLGSSQNLTTADINGDGLTDLVRYDRAAGVPKYLPSNGSSFAGPEAALMTDHPFGLTEPEAVLQVGDFGAKGLSGFGVFNPTNGVAEIAMPMGDVPDLLTGIANGLGGSTTITYQPSSRTKDSLLPFVLPVVVQTDVTDGMGNTYTTRYAYEGGRYGGPLRQKEFLGFAQASVRDAEDTASITFFHQDDHRKGRPFRSEVRDAQGALWSASEQTWTCADSAGSHFVRLDQTDAFIYDGDDTFRHTRLRFTYDAYGNITRVDEDGFVEEAGDERSVVAAYNLNTTDWVLNKPALTQTLNAAGAVAAQRRFVYDAKGNLSREEEWLADITASGSDRWLATNLTYDAFGNVATVTDALNRTTANTYDVTGTYLVQIRNHLGHTRQLAYDARFGAVSRSTDANAISTETKYDALGRTIKVIGPNDTAALPTVSYQYDLSPIAPSRTIVSTRIQSGQPDVLSVYAFTDGLGRTIQTRAPAENTAKQVVSGAVELNARGLAVKQWVSYLDDLSTDYAAPPTASLAAPVRYEYDAVGRLIKTTEPDGTESLINYNDGETTTSVDGHQTQKQVDAYGRLIQVEEVVSETESYTTTYAYDALGNLLRVTDHAGNITQIAYDSLGRKISMDDPDMGLWVYAYDDVDNLISQTDARGVVTAFIYDALNRLTSKSYNVSAAAGVANPGAVTYTYDTPNAAGEQFATGKLTKVVDASGISAFAYDNLGRLIAETKTIDSTPYTVNRAYDLLGRLATLTYPDNEVAAYTYNAQGGIETVTLDSQPIVSDIAYNAAGQLTKIVYGNGVATDYTYNPLTLRLSRLVTRSPSLATLQDFSYQFDSLGNVTEIQDAVHTASQTFEYDALSRLTQAGGAYGTLNYAYDPIGNMVDKESVAMTYGLADGSKPHAVTATADGWQMSYDANGNMLAKTSAATPFLDATYAYDAENRLVSVDSPQQDTVSVTFQPGWNFFSLPLVPDNAAVDALLPDFSQNFEQVARYEPSTGSFKHFVGDGRFDQFSTLEYGVGYQVYCKAASDVTVAIRGRFPSKRLSKPLSAGWHLLASTVTQSTAAGTYFANLAYDQLLDSAGQPVAQVEPGKSYWIHLTAAGTFSPSLPRSPSTSFVYDGDGGRVKQVTASGATTFVGELLEKTTSNTTKYVFAGSQRIASKSSVDGLRFYHGDHLGSTNLVTDASGTEVERTTHLPFGAIHAHSGARQSAHQFTGQRQDASTGLILFPARAYDPQLGRFIQPDTIVEDPANPQTLNRYSYVRNNPVNFIDPSGHFSLKKFFEKIFDWFKDKYAPQPSNPQWWTNTFGPQSPVAPGTAQQFNQAINATATFLVNQWGFSSAGASAVIGGGIGFLFGGPVGAAYGATTAFLSTTILETETAQRAITDFAEALIDIGVPERAAYTASATIVSAGVGMVTGAGVSTAVGFARGFAQGFGQGFQQGFESGTEIVQRAMSRAEYEATQNSGFLRGGQVGTTENPHYVSNAVNSNALRARQRLSLRQTPDVRVILKVPKGQFSAPSQVEPAYGMPGGGLERKATGKIPVKILGRKEY